LGLSDVRGKGASPSRTALGRQRKAAMRMWVVVWGLSLAATIISPIPVQATCTITGPYTVNCDGTTYRAVDDECVYFVDLAAHSAAHPGVSLPDLKKT